MAQVGPVEIKKNQFSFIAAFLYSSLNIRQPVQIDFNFTMFYKQYLRYQFDIYLMAHVEPNGGKSSARFTRCQNIANPVKNQF